MRLNFFSFYFKIRILIIVFVFLGLFFGFSYSNYDNCTGIYYKDFFIKYFDNLDIDTPSSYKYINLKYKNVYKGTKLYDSLQKGVYHGFFPNGDVVLPLNNIITQKNAYNLIKITLGKEINYNDNICLDENVLYEIIQDVNYFLSIKNNVYLDLESDLNDYVMQDVYDVLLKEYIDASSIDKINLKYGAIKGMVNSIGDEYSSFFPPTEAKNFNDSLMGEYYGIGAYVDLIEPGKFVIVSPLKNSPAQEAGLKGGDLVTHINYKEITIHMSLNDIINKVKGPEGTEVILTINRDGIVFEKTIKRAKITIEDLEYSILLQNNNNVCYIKINMFNIGVYNNFVIAMKYFQDKNCYKYIFDLRDNPGGSLNDVVSMLDYIVPTGEISVLVKTNATTEMYVSSNVSMPKITDKKIVVLINEGSASASEVFAGVVRDYGKNVSIIGQKSFGKGSVQNLREYADGSILKITIAKRYTGKSNSNVDGIGIIPDIYIANDDNSNYDNQLEYATNN